MAKVAVSLNGREFTVGCEDGQEAYIQELTAQIDKHVQTLAHRVGEIGDMRLLFMASLIIADERQEAKKKVQSLEAKIAEAERRAEAADARARMEEARLAEMLINAAERLERLTAETALDAASRREDAAGYAS